MPCLQFMHFLLKSIKSIVDHGPWRPWLRSPTEMLAHLLRFLYALAYFICTWLCSLFGPRIGDPKHVVDPSSIFAFINYVFVAWGFVISFAAVALSTLLNRLLQPDKMSTRQKISLGLIALGATSYWILWRLFFVWLDRESGSCRHETPIQHILRNRHACVQAGGYWDGLDISGHCFLIALACLFFYEQFYDGLVHYKKRPHQLAGYISTPQLELAEDNRQPPQPSRILSKSYIVSLSTCATIWLAWSSLLLHTSLYFHTIGEKLLGLLIGFAFWPLLVLARHLNGQAQTQT